MRWIDTHRTLFPRQQHWCSIDWCVRTTSGSRRWPGRQTDRMLYGQRVAPLLQYALQAALCRQFGRVWYAADPATELHLVERHRDDAQGDVGQDDGDAEDQRQRHHLAQLLPAVQRRPGFGVRAATSFPLIERSTYERPSVRAVMLHARNARGPSGPVPYRQGSGRVMWSCCS